MTTVETHLVKYVFLDVVAFTHKRSVEAQSDIVAALNQIVRGCLARAEVPDTGVIFLPTGDGMAIAVLQDTFPYDGHLLLALDMLKSVAEHSAQAPDDMRRFSVRAGISQNVDNLVIDINGRKNVAGAGINVAQRVMNVADGDQIIASQAVYDTLVNRERYMRSFRPFIAKIKHGEQLTVYQFVQNGFPGVSTDTPSRFVRVSPKEEPLTRLAAYYLAHALSNRDLFFQVKEKPLSIYANTVLLWLLAQDSLEQEQVTVYERPSTRVHRGSLNEALDYYLSLDFWVCCDFALFAQKELSALEPYIEETPSIGQFWVINDRGKRKLAADHPDLWKRFRLGEQIEHPAT